MGSNAKKKTTFAKLNRENKVRERRQRKQERRDARRQAAAEDRSAPRPATPGDPDVGVDGPAV